MSPPPSAVESSWAALERRLPAFVAAQRWYRSKTKPIARARVAAAFPLAFGASDARILIVDLSLEDGSRESYVVPLVWTAASARDEAALEDALERGDFLLELLAALSRGATFEDAGIVLRFRPAAPLEPYDGAAAVLGREQTNTTVRYGDRFVGKIVRKLDPGESPELEMERFLTAAGFTHAPRVVGYADLARGDEAGATGASRSTVAIFTEHVANRGDAWTHALDVITEWLAAAGARRAPDALGDLGEAIGPYAPLASLLGRRLAEMHVALAAGTGDAFAPAPIDAGALASLVASVKASLARVEDVTRAAAPPLPEDLVRRVDAAARAAASAGGGPAGLAIRVHGDLHLGQVLFTGDDFVLIDFEGEPARPLAERRRKRSPLVDVAGMLRSFDYASAAALRAQPAALRPLLAPLARFFCRAASAAFFEGWLGAVGDSALVPGDAAVTRALLDLFVIEKAAYEVDYERNNRPDWVEIPLSGLVDLARGA